jgi:hypothetical protein
MGLEVYTTVLEEHTASIFRGLDGITTQKTNIGFKEKVCFRESRLFILATLCSKIAPSLNLKFN